MTKTPKPFVFASNWPRWKGPVKILFIIGQTAANRGKAHWTGPAGVPQGVDNVRTSEMHAHYNEPNAKKKKKRNVIYT